MQYIFSCSYSDGYRTAGPTELEGGSPPKQSFQIRLTGYTPVRLYLAMANGTQHKSKLINILQFRKTFLVSCPSHLVSFLPPSHLVSFLPHLASSLPHLVGAASILSGKTSIPSSKVSASSGKLSTSSAKLPTSNSFLDNNDEVFFFLL